MEAATIAAVAAVAAAAAVFVLCQRRHAQPAAPRKRPHPAMQSPSHPAAAAGAWVRERECDATDCCTDKPQDSEEATAAAAAGTDAPRAGAEEGAAQAEGHGQDSVLRKRVRAAEERLRASKISASSTTPAQGPTPMETTGAPVPSAPPAATPPPAASAAVKRAGEKPPSSALASPSSSSLAASAPSTTPTTAAAATAAATARSAQPTTEQDTVLLVLSHVFSVDAAAPNSNATTSLSSSSSSLSPPRPRVVLEPERLPQAQLPADEYRRRVGALYDSLRPAAGGQDLAFACGVYDKTLTFERDYSKLPLIDVATALLPALRAAAVEATLAAMTPATSALPAWARSMGHAPTQELLQRAAHRAKDGANMPEAMLAAVLERAPESVVRSLLETALAAVNGLQQLHVLVEIEATLVALYNLAKAPAVGHAVALACRAAAEANARQREAGNLATVASLFTPLLRHTPLSPAMENTLVREAYGADPRSQRGREGVDLIRRRVEESTLRLTQVLHELMRAGLKRGGEDRDAVVAWLASLVALSEVRLRIKDHTAPPLVQRAIFEGHGPAINFARLLLMLAEPFARAPQKLGAVDPLYWQRNPRLNCEDARVLALRQSFQAEEQAAVRALMDAEGVDAEVAQQLHQAMKMSLNEGEGAFNLVTEMFFTTLRALHVCILPAVDGLGLQMQTLHHGLAGLQPGTQEHAKKDLQLMLTHDRWEMALFDPAVVDGVTQFYLAAAHWLDARLEADASDACLATVPDFIVKDLATWVAHIARHHPRFMRPPTVSSPTLRPLVSMSAALLARPAVVPGPVVTSKVIAMLRALIETGASSGVETGNPLAHDGPLAFEVVDHPAMQRSIAPALLRAYYAVDMVEGLDVDKEEFDKYSVKHEMAVLLKRLWVSPVHRAAVLAQPSAVLEDFAQSLLELLLFTSGGAFDSLREIRGFERVMADKAAWSARTPESRAEIEQNFQKKLSFVPHALRGSMDSLSALTDMLSEASMCKVLCSSRLASKTASLVTHFIAKLAGPLRTDFDIEHVATVKFDPHGFLVQIARLCVRLLAHPHASEHLLLALSRDVEYSASLGDTFVQLVVSRHTRLLSPDELQLLSGLPAAIAAAQRKPTAAPVAEAATVADSVEAYEAAMRPLVFGAASFRARAEGAEAASDDDDDDDANVVYDHDFRSAIAASTGTPVKMRRLLKEMQELPAMLPLHRDAAIFVRHDESRMDVIRALITGPPGTPYAQGCFAFDIFCPDEYPRVPPLVKLLTTGGGRVRFNPNLYNDGKVCLSLLGTFHGGDSSQKWDPAVSSIYQVLLSIQGMILVDQPLYNEPGTQGQGTPEGDRRSNEYNAPLREATMKFAMLEIMLRPPVGFEEVVRKHFLTNRDMVLRVCNEWIRTAEPDAAARMRDIQAKIAQQIASL